MGRFFILLTVVLLSSCEYNDIGLRSGPINSRIIIETQEILEPKSRRLTFFCATDSLYTCANFFLITEKEIEEKSLKVTFTSVGISDFCLHAYGPATTSVDFSTLPKGEYSIQFNIKNLQNKGTLKVTNTDISLLFGQKDRIEFVRETTKRVPDKTYWVTIGYHEESSSILIDEFIQKFADAGAVFDKQSPGHYYYYEINASGDIIADVENSGYRLLKKFIFQYEGDESKLKELVQVDGKNYKESLSMRLETYKGEMYYNWGN